jgi:oxygen-independent coproporphyrinogen-3 oxidase
LPTAYVDDIIRAAKNLFRVEEDAEITLEANPATADAEKLLALRRAGVNRLSVGVQSLSDTELSALGRRHSAKDALSFLESARRAGFTNINVDLMLGIPHQTEMTLRDTLSHILAFSPEHISAYSLMLEEGTPLYEKRVSLPLPDEETEEALNDTVGEILAGAGYEHYEISNYARAGYSCRHNLHYWHSDPYLGFGVAAYSFFGGERYGNHADLGKYLSAPATARADTEAVTQNSLAYEWIMLRLRLKEGLCLSEYKARFGVELKEKHGSEIAQFSSLGLMREVGGRLALTERGFRVSNSILVAFMPENG